MVISYRVNEDEAAAAWAVAQRRNTLNGGQSNIPGGETASHEERARQHYCACLAEIAVARHLNLSWTGCGRGASGLCDVGGFVEVRSITDAKKGLLVREKDEIHAPYVLVLVHEDRTCDLLGFAWGKAVREHGRPFDYDTDRPCWILPQSLLRPIEDFYERDITAA